LVTIHQANDAIADAPLSACIDRIEQACRTILQRLEETPSLQPQLRTFLRYYLPTTVKLLAARAQLEPEQAESENARQTRARTERVLAQIDASFQKQLEALDKNRYMDIQVEMDVLEGMLRSDDPQPSRPISKGDTQP
ncbi:MAG: 5-bromo-4-chloroindolyl phosphate hydrolysis family protein, partial [Clostridia bacterium]